VKARVVTLEEIPWFIVGTEGPDFHGDSWIIQVEIIQAKMLGGMGGDEDVPPGPDNINPEMFDFFGFGQPGPGPIQGFPDQEPADGDGNVEGWGLWPQQDHLDDGLQQADWPP
jgi:hypothetical protein